MAINWDSDHDARRRLLELLSRLADERSVIRTLCRAAGIELSQISLVGASRNIWFSVIAEARQQGRLPALLDTVASHYPRNAQVQRFVAESRSPFESLRSPSFGLDRPPPSRSLQIHLRAFRGGALYTGLQSMVAGAFHRIEVRIAAGEPGWTIADRPFPAERLPHDVPNELKVVLTAPGFLPGPVEETITLPVEGASSVAAFALTIGSDATFFDARITVLHYNRVLQTARLLSPINPSGDAVDDHPMRLVVECVARTDLDDLSTRSHFDGALLFNHDASGQSTLTRFTNLGVSMIDVGTALGQSQSIAGLLASVAEDPEAYRDVRGDKVRLLLGAVARVGRALHDQLIGDNEVPWSLRQSLRLQVIAREQDVVIPLELCYSFDAPQEDAVVCPAWLDGHGGGATCEGHGEGVACPFGFWGMSRTIERHMFRAVHRQELGSFDAGLIDAPTEGRDVLALGRSVLFGASVRTDAVDATVTQRTLDALRDQVDVHAVENWEDWKVEVSRHRPALLVVLGHTERRDPDGLVMEIGREHFLHFGRVVEGHVRAVATDVPIVLLMGCKTALPEASWMSFVGPFRRAKAAIIIANLPAVAGRDAGPTAAAVVEHLRALRPGADGRWPTVGETLRDVRRSLVAAGHLNALGLVAFGDADWKIEVTLAS